MEVKEGEVVLCKFYFTDLKQSKNRPVLVFKDNLPYEDFVAIPISSKVRQLHEDEVLIDNNDFFEGTLPVPSKIIIRKTFVVSKDSIIKKYGLLTQRAYHKYCNKYCNKFCKYFGCI